MRLSKNFSLKELIRSETATRKNINNNPNEDNIENLQRLCDHVLQPVRDHFGKVVSVSSGFRRPELCVAIGSKRSSQHALGMASDIQFHKNGVMNNKLLMDTIIEHCEFDQLINEFDYSWIHVSYNCDNNRNQILKAYKENGKTKYSDITQNYISL